MWCCDRRGKGTTGTGSRWDEPSHSTLDGLVAWDTLGSALSANLPLLRLELSSPGRGGRPHLDPGHGGWCDLPGARSSARFPTPRASHRLAVLCCGTP